MTHQPKYTSAREIADLKKENAKLLAIIEDVHLCIVHGMTNPNYYGKNKSATDCTIEGRIVKAIYKTIAKARG